MNTKSCRLLLVLLCLALGLTAPAAAEGELQFTDLGECPLESGQVIRDCRLGYRTFGTLNADKSNAVLFPTWFAGKSEELVPLIGEGKLVDSSKYFVVAVDAFGNGVSSSPSNSPGQAGESFPVFTIRDIVRAQHRLLTEVLDVHHLRAAIGISMGGAQVFEWLVSFPDFLDAGISMVATPQPSPSTLLLMETTARLYAAWQQHPSQEMAEALRGLWLLHLRAPGYYDRTLSREEVAPFLRQRMLIEGHPLDLASQNRAGLRHDVAQPFGGSLEEAARQVRARVLIIIARHDHIRGLGTAREFARLVGADLVELDSDCGHLAVQCEAEKVTAVVHSFLAASVGTP